MSVGLSLHLGLNSIDPAHYGSDGSLAGCENDARSMEEIAKNMGYRTLRFLTKEATSKALLDSLQIASSKLVAGDTFLLTYAGHGSQIPDKAGDEADGKDETWVLYDRMFTDDELYEAWTKFAPGVRIILVSDSCHSGTVARVMEFEQSVAIKRSIGTDVTPKPRGLPPSFALKAIESNPDVYEQFFSRRRDIGQRAEVAAGIILLSGCMDNQVSADGGTNGLFTSKLLLSLNESPVDYPTLHQKILQKMPREQSPNYLKVGVVDTDFEMSRPFSLTQSGPTTQKGWCSMTIGSGFSSKANQRGFGGDFGGCFGGGFGGRSRPWEDSGGVSVGSRCVLDMDMDLGRMRDMSDDQIFAFFQSRGAELMMNAFVNARDAAKTIVPAQTDTRGWEVSVGGKFGGRGLDWGVEVKGTWHF